MIERKCSLCEGKRSRCAQGIPCDEFTPTRAALEARIEALEGVATKLAAEATMVINDVIAKAFEARTERARYRRALIEANRRRRAERTRDTAWSQSDDPEDL